jgi:hypothetical protein
MPRLLRMLPRRVSARDFSSRYLVGAGGSSFFSSSSFLSPLSSFFAAGSWITDRIDAVPGRVAGWLADGMPGSTICGLAGG